MKRIKAQKLDKKIIEIKCQGKFLKKKLRKRIKKIAIKRMRTKIGLKN